MRIGIFINGFEYLSVGNNFSKSFLKIITETAQQQKHRELHQKKANEIAILTDICREDELVFVMDNHITLDLDFVNKIKAFDIVYCSCLKAKTEIGEIIKELMIDNYQLILTHRNWIETDYLKLYFEAVDYGEADITCINTIKNFR